MATKKYINKEMPLPKWYKFIILFIIIGLICLMAYLLYMRSGWPEYNSAVKDCGGDQPIIGQSFGKTYYRPGDRGYKSPGSDIYFCSEREARAAGYRLPATIEKRY